MVIALAVKRLILVRMPEIDFRVGDYDYVISVAVLPPDQLCIILSQCLYNNYPHPNKHEINSIYNSIYVSFPGYKS